MSGLFSVRRTPPAPAAVSSAGPAAAIAGERCEFCGEQIAGEHGHVADLVDHRLLCVCRPCYLLFAPQGAGGGRYRGVGEEVRRVVDPVVTPEAWEALGIPVDLAFLFRQDERLVAFYPGPGGATECELDLGAWSVVTAANPVLATLESDVEAVLLRRHDDRWDVYLVPVDRCYELVGAVRRHWVGLAGGSEVWAVIDAWFTTLAARAREASRG